MLRLLKHCKSFYFFKENARNNIKNFLDNGPVSTSQPEWSVRINPVVEKELCEKDIDVLLSAKNLPISICLPKVHHVDHLQWVQKYIYKKFN